MQTFYWFTAPKSFWALSFCRVSILVFDVFVVLHLSVASEENKFSHQIWTAEVEDDQHESCELVLVVCRLRWSHAGPTEPVRGRSNLISATLQMDLSRILLRIPHYSMYSQTIRQVFTQHCCFVFFSRGLTKMSSSQTKGSGHSAGLCLWLLYCFHNGAIWQIYILSLNPTFSHSCVILTRNIRWVLSAVGGLACANDESGAFRSLVAKTRLLWDSCKVPGGVITF